MTDEKYHVVLRNKDLVDIPFRVLTQMFWRPQAYDVLHNSHLPDAIRERKIDRLNQLWQKQESWVNHSVDAIFGSLPPLVIGQIMNKLMPAITPTPLTPYECRAGAMKRYLGVPDLFFSGDGQAVAGEIKIGATAQNGKYSFEQYAKYLTLALFMRASRRPDLPKQVVHLLIVPTLDPKKFCLDFEQWKPEVKDGWLVVNPKNVLYIDRKKRFKDNAGWREEILAVMRNKRYALPNEIDPDEVGIIEKNLGLDLMQTRVVTWSEFTSLTKSVATSFGLGHLTRSCDFLCKLGIGSEPHLAD